MGSLFAIMFSQLHNGLKRVWKQTGLAQQTPLESSLAKLNVNAENDTEMHKAM